MATTTRRKRKIPLPPSGPEVEYVTREEGIAILDRQARKRLGMSGEEFVRRFQAGEIEDTDRSDVILVAMLIPFADE